MRSSPSRTLFLFLFTCVAHSAWALPRTLDWGTVVRQAADADEQLKASIQEERSYRETYRASFATWYPALQAYGKKANNNQRLDNQQVDSNESSYGLQTKLNVFSGFSTWSNNEATWSQYQAAVENRRELESDILNDLRSSYGQVFVLQREIKFLKSTRDRRDLFAQMLQIKYRDGMEARWSLDQARVEVEALDMEIESRLEQITSQKESLAIRIGEKPDFELAPVDFPVLSEVLKRAPSVHPALAKIESSIRQINFEKKATDAAFWPVVDVSYRLERVRQNQFDWADNHGWLITASWDLFTGFSTKHTADAQIERKGGLELSLARERKVLLANQSKAKRSYDVTLRLLKTKESQLAVAHARLDVVENQFRTGRRTFAEWEQAQNYLSTTERDIIQIEADAITYLAALQSSLGIGLQDGVMP